MSNRGSPGRHRGASSGRDTKRKTSSEPRRAAFVVLWCALAAVSLLTAGIWIKSNRAKYGYSPRPPRTLTFNKDIAPIVFKHCSNCHRPDQSAPFSLLTHDDVRKRAKQIAEVTQRRYMPPWLPEPGYGEFADARRLTDDQIGMIQQWATEGAVEGSPTDLPPAPKWAEGWQLGEPDLVLTMPQLFVLSAKGRDVYRNFVIPVPVAGKRYVRAVELRPGNPKAVHHIIFRVDHTRQSRRLDERDVEPGFPGMDRSETARVPDGQFVGWQPGKMPAPAPDGLAWILEKDADVILEMHLRPTGKPEAIQPSVGFYFTEQPPTNTPFKLRLTSYSIDIPPGVRDYAVKHEYALPADVELLGVLPHAHYLCKTMEGFATLPNGTSLRLLRINDWDFDWQGDYRYASPVFLPKGTVLSMRFTYDNSTRNKRNPNTPPKKVTYGPESTDEMAELWFQVVLQNREDLPALTADYQSKMKRVILEHFEYRVREQPHDAGSRAGLGLAYLNLRRYHEAHDHLRAAVQLDPRLDEAHYYLGLLFRVRKQLAEARNEFETTLQINPDHFKAHGNLGLVFMEQGETELAKSHFESALRINPADEIAREGLELLHRAGSAPAQRE